MTTFVTVTQFLQRFDSRWIGKNILDDGTAATVAQMQNPSTTAGATLLALLTDASEELMAAASVGARYTEQDLRTYGGNLLLSVVSGLALGPILERRGRAVTDFAKLSASYDKAAARVEELRRGERIFFAVPGVPEAGLTESANMDPQPPQCPLLSFDATRYFGFPAAGNYPPRPPTTM